LRVPRYYNFIVDTLVFRVVNKGITYIFTSIINIKVIDIIV